MEDLNKNQIVLLTLLVSFVTSIATGIMTVSLLQEAPLEVTRNINRIVEKTIETVTPTVVTTDGGKVTTTVVLKEEDLILNSINKNINSIARIKEKDGLTFTTSTYGIGLVVRKDGVIVADRDVIVSGNGYTAVMSDGTELPLTPLKTDKQTNFILFKANQPDKLATKADYVFVPAVISDTSPKLGQTIIGLGGLISNSVSVGRVVSLYEKESGTGSSTLKFLSSIETDLSGKDLLTGSPLFDLSGNVIGIKTSADSSKVFTAGAILKKEIGVLEE